MGKNINQLNNSLNNIEKRMSELRNDSKVKVFENLIKSYERIKGEIEELKIQNVRTCEHQVVRVRTENHNSCLYGCIKCGLTSKADFLYEVMHLPANEVIKKTSLFEFKTMDVQKTLSSFPMKSLDAVDLEEFYSMRRDYKKDAKMNIK